MLTPDFQQFDQLLVIISKNQVSNHNPVNTAALTFLVGELKSFLQYDFLKILGQLCFNNLDQVFFEVQRRRHILILAILVKPLLIIFFVDRHLDCVVPSCDRGHIPLDLVNFSTQVNPSHDNCEEACG